VLAMPAIYVVPEATDLNSVASEFAVDGSRLLSANPNLPDQGSIDAGTVLVVPRGTEDLP